MIQTVASGWGGSLHCSQSLPALPSRLGCDAAPLPATALNGLLPSAAFMMPPSVSLTVDIKASHTTKKLSARAAPYSPTTKTPTAALDDLKLDSPAFNTRRKSLEGHKKMKEEVARLADREAKAAASWWMNKLQLKGVHPQTRKVFEENFVEEVFNRCAGHWYPTDPKRGSGYRSVISDAHIDPILLKACQAARLDPSVLPREFVQLISPGEVRVRHVLNEYHEEIVYSGVATLVDDHV